MSAIRTVRDTIDRDLADEPQTVVKVYEQNRLRGDLLDYVLTDQLAREFAKVLGRVVDGAQPGGNGDSRVGIWVSGFFGSGKSHFAKLIGHLLANTPVGSDTARILFQRLLHPGRAADERVREILHEATTHRLAFHMVALDMTALQSLASERNVGLVFLRALYASLGLSDLIAFAEREIELQAMGRYEEFLWLYEEKSGVSWQEDKTLSSSSGIFAECLAEILPQRYSSPQIASDSLNIGMVDAERHLSIDGIVDRLLRWLDSPQRAPGSAPQRLVFVADEVGVWAGSNLDRIEQLRSLVETISVKGNGRIWLVATSQEKLSAVVSNAPTSDAQLTRDLLQRLEARYQTNVHLESSEVGSVIEVRILRKKPTARPALERIWSERQQQLRDVADPPGLDLGASYPHADRDPFVRDYPFLPYQIEAAADIFGGMRGVKVSSGARSMIRVVFDATKTLADRPLGAVVSWDQIFDSANRDNEFADEQYLGSQGLTYLATADRDVKNAPLQCPARVLKVLWLVQQTRRIPRTPANLARLLVDDLDADVLKLEQDVAATLEALAAKDYVRQEPATGQWRFLTQDEVTVEKIVRQLGDEVRQQELRDEIVKLHQAQLKDSVSGQLRVGKTNTTFKYGVWLDGVAEKNEDAPVSLKAARPGTAAAQDAVAHRESNLDEPAVYWVFGPAKGLDGRLRRAIAIERLEQDERFRQIATDRTRTEAGKLLVEATQLRQDAETEVADAFQRGTLYYAGTTVPLDDSARGALGGKPITPKTRIDNALVDRINVAYYRFAEGDRPFGAQNVDRVLTGSPSDRAKLDPALGLFSTDGHVNGGHPIVEELSRYLKSSAKITGGDVQDHFAGVPFGWPADLLRYAAAAMFTDGKLALIDRGGKRYDDPSQAPARQLMGTAAFRTARLEIEEDALSPAESDAARKILTDLGQRPADSGEIALKEATLQLVTSLTRRLAVVDKAAEVELPLPEVYARIAPTLEAIVGAGSRVKVIRALIAQDKQLRDSAAALDRLEEFQKSSGFAQFSRAVKLRSAALGAGLDEDPNWGGVVQNAAAQIQAICAQRRVLDEWSSSFSTYRQKVLDSFRAVYVPLREDLAKRSSGAQAAIKAMPEYKALLLDGHMKLRNEFLGQGKPLQEVSLPELKNEQQLLDANEAFSIGYLRSALAALDSELSRARTRVIELFNGQNNGPKPTPVVTWKASAALGGQRYQTEDDVDRALDQAKEALKRLVREGKTIQVV
jgi:hypothetical protein